jgi:hypothetical protein
MSTHLFDSTPRAGKTDDVDEIESGKRRRRQNKHPKKTTSTEYKPKKDDVDEIESGKDDVAVKNIFKTTTWTKPRTRKKDDVDSPNADRGDRSGGLPVTFVR